MVNGSTAPSRQRPVRSRGTAEALSRPQVQVALGWACWKTYLGRQEEHGEVRCMAMGALGTALISSRPDEALPVCQTNLALMRRYFPHSQEAIINAQGNLGNLLMKLGRLDESLALKRDIHAKQVAALGVSHQKAILGGVNIVNSLNALKRFDESKLLVRDQLLPTARQSLGADHHLTIQLNRCLAKALHDNPERTRAPPASQSTRCRDVATHFLSQHSCRHDRGRVHHARRGTAPASGLGPRASTDGQL